MLYDIGVAKWPIATYFWFITYPDTHVFVKPEVTKHAALMAGGVRIAHFEHHDSSAPR